MSLQFPQSKMVITMFVILCKNCMFLKYKMSIYKENKNSMQYPSYPTHHFDS